MKEERIEVGTVDEMRECIGQCINLSDYLNEVEMIAATAGATDAEKKAATHGKALAVVIAMAALYVENLKKDDAPQAVQ